MPESQACNFIKEETLAQVFYCEFCKISKNNFFTEQLWTTASEFITDMLTFRSSPSQMFFKISVLKNLAILESLSNYKPSFTEHLRRLLLNFCGSKYFFAAEYGIIADNCTGSEADTRSVLLSKGVLRNFVKLTGKRLLKKRLWHKCFPLNFAKFRRTPFLQNTYGRLRLPVFVLDSFENTS